MPGGNPLTAIVVARALAGRRQEADADAQPAAVPPARSAPAQERVRSPLLEAASRTIAHAHVAVGRIVPAFWRAV
jgi:hypothetical protein